ncbi:translation initiation factor IF-2-like [Pristis pectinata]|uniref:translation initiation factor IF-2-like n=1 Tax=Pristis pectinata TaxID=685728 RepID=UPI00223E6413|nr:translation initiation factor IF-2-like [Pristis pectinata]
MAASHHPTTRTTNGGQLFPSPAAARPLAPAQPGEGEPRISTRPSDNQLTPRLPSPPYVQPDGAGCAPVPLPHTMPHIHPARSTQPAKLSPAAHSAERERETIISSEDALGNMAAPNLLKPLSGVTNTWKREVTTRSGIAHLHADILHRFFTDQQILQADARVKAEERGSRRPGAPHEHSHWAAGAGSRSLSIPGRAVEGGRGPGPQPPPATLAPAPLRPEKRHHSGTPHSGGERSPSPVLNGGVAVGGSWSRSGFPPNPGGLPAGASRSPHPGGLPFPPPHPPGGSRPGCPTAPPRGLPAGASPPHPGGLPFPPPSPGGRPAPAHLPRGGPGRGVLPHPGVSRPPPAIPRGASRSCPPPPGGVPLLPGGGSWPGRPAPSPGGFCSPRGLPAGVSPLPPRPGPDPSAPSVHGLGCAELGWTSGVTAGGSLPAEIIGLDANGSIVSARGAVCLRPELAPSESTIQATADGALWNKEQTAGGTQWLEQHLWRQRDGRCFRTRLHTGRREHYGYQTGVRSHYTVTGSHELGTSGQ